MADIVTEFRAADLAREVTLSYRITGMKVWRARLWIAGLIFQIGAIVAGVGIEMTDRD
ncbi:hypothetical protein BH11PSE1_BH11PSE1_16370 [soil metagenome]